MRDNVQKELHGAGASELDVRELQQLAVAIQKAGKKMPTLSAGVKERIAHVPAEEEPGRSLLFTFSLAGGMAVVLFVIGLQLVTGSPFRQVQQGADRVRIWLQPEQQQLPPADAPTPETDPLPSTMMPLEPSEEEPKDKADESNRERDNRRGNENNKKERRENRDGRNSRPGQGSQRNQRHNQGRDATNKNNQGTRTKNR